MLGLYIHIPFCLQKCAYCDFCSFAATEEEKERYTVAVIGEIALQSHNATECSVDTVFFGGGTPTLLSAGQLERIFRELRTRFSLTADVEITVEANPATISEGHLALFLQEGVTRVSLGVQAVQDALLKRIGRVHTFDDVLSTYRRLRKAGSWDINMDLIYHLPGQTKAQWRHTLETVVALNPQHISCYSLQLEDGTPLAKAVEDGRYPLSGDGTDRRMHHMAIEYLEKSGYNHYEISNFSKPGKQSRHNMKYWKRQPYIGVGLAAHGFDGTVRWANPEDLSEYLLAVEAGSLPMKAIETLTPEDAFFEAVMLGLRLREGVSERVVSALCAESKRARFMDTVEGLVGQGLLQRSDDVLSLTRKGMDLSNRVFGKFMDL